MVRRVRLSRGVSDREFLARPARPFDPRRDEPGDADDRGKGPAAPMPEDLLISTDGRVGRLSLNRPKAIHALNLPKCEAMIDALVGWRGDAADEPVIIASSDTHPAEPQSVQSISD